MNLDLLSTECGGKPVSLCLSQRKKAIMDTRRGIEDTVDINGGEEGEYLGETRRQE